MNNNNNILDRIQQYRMDSSVNQSYLKSLLEYKDEQYTIVNKRQLHFDLGNAVETKLLYPEEYDSLIEVRDITIPSGVVGTIILDMIEMGCEELDESIILELAEKYSYGNGKFKDERIIRDIKTKGEDYFYALLETKDKIILTPEEGQIVNNCTEALSSFFDKNIELFNSESEVQKFVKSEIDGIACKGLLDIYNPASNRIVDIKLTSFNNVRSAAKNFRYDFQLSFYNHLINKGEDNSRCYLVFVNRNDYSIACLELTSNDLDIGRRGTKYYYKQYLTSKGEISKIAFMRDNELYGWEFALDLHKNNLRLEKEVFYTGIYD